MMWTKAKIGDCCEITSSKRIFFSEYVESGIPFYRSKEIIELSNCQEISDPLYISESKYDEIAHKFGIPQPGDMLLTSVGTIGIPYIVKEKDTFYFKDGNLTWFRNFNERLDSRYLFYWVKSAEGQGVLNNTTIGSSQKALTIAALKDLKILCPPIGIQNRIVEILTSYDDLIENNQKQIKLLEEAAQRLYKEWFVDLRFPGHENTKITDGIPEGWSLSTVGKICKLKKETVVLTKIPANTPYIGLEHMPRSDFCLSSWGNAEDATSNKFLYAVDDIVFAKIRPYFHKVGFTLNNGIASTDSFVMKATEGLWGLLLMTVFDKTFVEYTCQTCREGAKMPRADWSQMEKYSVLIPDENIRKQFEDYIWKVTRQIRTLALQNRMLSEARDRLLPKLINGEIEV